VLSVLPPLAVAAVVGTAGLAGAAVSAHGTAAATTTTTTPPGATGAGTGTGTTAPTNTATATATTTTSSTTPTDDGTLSAASTSVAEGSTLTFDYAVGSAGDVNSENWIGIYDDPGCGPVNQTYDCGSNTYNWVTNASGISSFNTAGWAPGNYIAYFLYDNGYTWLAKPVAFTVTKPKPIPAPTYKGTFASGLSSPSGVAVDGNGDVWVTDSGANRVVEYSASGRKLREFGRSGSSAGVLNDPTAIAVDASGNVYVADTGDNRAEEFTGLGKFVRAYYTANSVGFENPQGIAVDGKGDVYISDTENNRVAEFSASGDYIRAVTTDMSGPEGLAFDATGDLWVANAGQYDAGGEQAVELSTSGSTLIKIGGDTSSNLGGLSDPSDVAVDTNGHVFIADPDYSLLYEFDVTGPYGNEFGATQLSSALAVALAPNGDILVADFGDGRIVTYVPSVNS
jgi:hypothetical protein